MSKIKQFKLNHILIGGSLFLGLILMVAGQFNGNIAALPVNVESTLQKSISLADVQNLKQKYKNRIKIVEFSNTNKCLNNIGSFKFQKCYTTAQLNDVKWLRKAFSTIKRPVVIYSQKENDSQKASDILKYYGYRVLVLMEDGKITNNLRTPVAPKELLVAKVEQNNVGVLDEIFTPVAETASDVSVQNQQKSVTTSNLITDIEVEEEDEEEEEEGC